jgi:mannose-1-phosphate guanylyltransferase
VKALLLAAGLGTRLRPLTDSIPKCLTPICGRPLLQIWLDSLSDAGIGPFLVNSHYLPQAVEQFISASVYRPQITLVYETELLGTGGTLLANRDFFGREPLMVIHADNLCVCDLRSFVEAHARRESGTVMTMMTFRSDAPETCGIVEVDAKGVVLSFHEKVSDPPGNLANGAVYILEPEVCDFMAELAGPTVDFSTQVLPHFVGRIQAWQNPQIHRDIGTIASLNMAQAEFLSCHSARSEGAR